LLLSRQKGHGLSSLEKDRIKNNLKGDNMTGTIKKLDKVKKFGFIRATDGKEYFFHSSALKNAKFDDLQEGQEVTEFEDAEGAKGPRAEDVYI
jgi:cold shock CspA family protein